MRGNRRPPRHQKPHRINREIRAQVVRVVGEEADNEVHPIGDALRLAQDAGLDLVEISPTAKPPVCKIIDYNKYLYQENKKKKAQKAKSAKVEVKEIRLGPQTEEHDFNFKLNHAVKFLKDGNKVKVDVFFKGRSIMYKEQGELMLLKFANALEEIGKVERLPKLEGKRMIMILSPKSSK
jgi:translation initiation factor IF-3